MGKWAARLAEKTAAPLYGGTDKTAKRELLSVLAVSQKGTALEVQAATMLASQQAARLEAIDLSSVAWTGAQISTFVQQRGRMLRWRFAKPDAERLAELLTVRDRESDDRQMCVECKHLEWSGRCAQARAGRLPGSDRQLEPVRTILQRCVEFRELP